MVTRLYAGPSVRSRKEPIVYSCPCGERFRAEVWRAVDSADAEALRLVDGTLNRIECPACGAAHSAAVTVVYHDRAVPRLVLVLPEAARHRELAERARLFEALAADAEPPTPYVLAPEVVFGVAALGASAAVGEAVGDDSGPTRVRVPVPDPRDAATERWIAGREAPAAFLVDDSLLLCASLAPAGLEAFLPGQVELRVQLHRLPSYPVLALTLIALNPSAARPGEHQVVTVPLDIARAAHRVVLEALGRRAEVTLELYDADYLPAVAHRLAAPLEENVKRLFGEARDALDRLAPSARSFERARAQLLGAGYDRLGRTPVDLPDENLAALERPGAVRAALHAVARWSEPSAEAYLVEIRGLPLPVWRSLRARVVRRALDVGIAVPRPLVERSAREHGAPLPSWPELLQIQVRRFAEASTRTRPNDLLPVEEAENWELLLRECALAGVVVDEALGQIAAAAVKRARAGAASGVELRALPTAELVGLLERKEARREAAQALCERREPQTLPSLFAAIRRMPRGEANLVLPAVTAFGAHAERWLVEGLRSKKSFMRQGCALGLGVLKTPLGTDALVKLLVGEPTEIWTEVARALGDVGAAAVMPLAARLRDVDAEGQERIVHAFAHVVARGARAPVAELGAGRDAWVATAAQRALAAAGQVQLADAALRRGGGDTVVRGFSRRFYEAMAPAGSSIELSPADLEEIDAEAEAEALDDEDVLTSTDVAPLARVSTLRTKTSLPRER
jgi:hypothetical protein